ncbi:MAG: zinc-dependent alcohol dehydrogenase [Armatimonadota bacterium]
MKAVRLYGPREFHIDEIPEPQAGPGEVKIAVRSVSVCASDVHYYLYGEIGSLKTAGPFILGHEFSGEIAEIGPGVQGDLRIGQKVTAEPVRPCGSCDCCLRGDYHLCRRLLFFGTPPANGCLCEYVTCRADFTFALPNSVSLDEGAMTEPLAVGVESAEISGIRGGETCLVLGAGAIGLSALQAVKAAGAGTVLVVEPIKERRLLALALGAAKAFAPSEMDAVMQEFPGGADVVIEAAGVPEAPQTAVECARPGGTVVLVGIPEEDRIAFKASTARRKALTIRFVRRYKHKFPRALELVSHGLADVRSYATHFFPPEKTADAFELTASRSRGVLRAVIRF